MTDNIEPAAAVAYDSPQKIAPVTELSSRGLMLALAATCLVPLCGLTVYAAFFGRAADRPLPVVVEVANRPIERADGRGSILDHVIVVTNTADFDIPNVTADLNGQYFLYRDSPLMAGESIVIRQSIFATKANQMFVPGRYPITDVTITGKLPSGGRGVTEVLFDLDGQPLEPPTTEE